MKQVTITTTLLLGNDDATVNIFNDSVSYTHYFSAVNPLDWVLALDPGDYLVGMVGTVAPGGRVIISIIGIVSSTSPMPQTFISAGKFIKGVSITV